MKAYPKIAFSEMLPADVQVDELLENLEEMDDIDYPTLRYEDNKFSWYGKGDEHDTEYEELEGIILLFQRQRGRFRDNINQKESERISCQSPCGKKGYTYVGGEEELILTPRDGIDCKRCSYKDFTKDSVLRVCRKQIKLFFLVKGSCIPQTLYLDPEATDFFSGSYLINRIVRDGLTYFSVVTKISLKDGKPNFQVVGKLEGKHKEFRDHFIDSMRKDSTLYENQFRASFPHGKVDTCSCNLWRGCTCGMLHREQLARTNFYNEMGY